jgi:hypothetical protein
MHHNRKYLYISTNMEMIDHIGARVHRYSRREGGDFQESLDAGQ